MRGRNKVLVMACTLVMAWPMAVAAASGGGPKPDAGVAQRGIRLPQDATFTAGRTPDGAPVLTIDSPIVSIEKRIYPQQIDIRVVEKPGHDSVSVVVRPGELSVSRRGGAATVLHAGKAGDEAGAVRALLAESGAVAALAHLTAAVSRDSSPTADAFVTAGELIAFIAGDSRAPERLAARARGRGNVRVRAVAQRTTEECWQQYEKDAIAILDAADACIQSCAWYNGVCKVECSLEYILREELAFSWLIACNGGFFAS